MKQFIRTEMLLGKEGMERLKRARIAVFGIGGVGGYTVEALARSGVGALELIDNDTVSESNINRQIIALFNTVGRKKVEVMAERIAQINPDAIVKCHDCFYLPETAERFDFTAYDYVIDAVDTITAKLDIIMRAKQAKIKVISSMGAGNKLNPALFEVADIFETSVCPLARVMRRELKARGIKDLKVVYSKEPPVLKERMPLEQETDKAARKRSVPGSIAFVPAAAGLLLAGEVIRDLCNL